MSKPIVNFPEETRVYYDRELVAIGFPFFIMCFVMGLYLLFFTSLVTFGSIASLICLAKLIVDYKIYTDRAPQLIINHDGIIMSDNKFIPWKNVERFEVEYFAFRKTYYLVIEAGDASRKYNVRPWHVEIDKLNNLIDTYRPKQ